MQIFVVSVSGKTTTLDVEPSDLVANVKARIEVEEGVPPAHQRLIFEGVILQDSCNLYDYNIKEESTVNLILCLWGT